MPTSYTPSLGLALPVQGELEGSWGDVTNAEITTRVETAIAGLETISSWTSNAYTLTYNTGDDSEARSAILVLSGSLTAAGTLTIPQVTKVYAIRNSTNQSVGVTTGTGSTVTLAVGENVSVFCDNTDTFRLTPESTDGVTPTDAKLIDSVEVKSAGAPYVGFRDEFDNLNSTIQMDSDGEALTLSAEGPLNNGYMEFFTAGSNTPALFLDTTSFVGINEIDPDRHLHVNSGASNISALFESSDASSFISFRDDGTTSDVLVGATNDDFRVNTNDSESFRITQGGDVGISEDSPERSLHITKSVPSIRLEDLDTPGLYHEFVGLAGGEFSIRSNQANVPGDNFVSFRSGSARTAYIGTDGVTIGTTVDPRTALDVTTGLANDTGGEIGITLGGEGNATQRTAQIIKNTAASGNDRELRIIGSTGTSGSDILIESAIGTPTMVLKPSGDVGIGTDTPTKLSTTYRGLELKSEDPSTGGIITLSTSENERCYMYSSNTNLAFRAEGAFVWQDAAGDLMTLAATGNLTVSGEVAADDFVVSSDQRLKSNIVTLDGRKVLDMHGVSFVKNDKPSAGVIAQELEEVAPDLVSVGEDGYKQVALQNIVGYLIESTKMQQKQIDEQKEKIDDLTDILVRNGMI